MKRGIRHFHVVVVQWRQKNVQDKRGVTCKFVFLFNKPFCFFLRSRCRRPRSAASTTSKTLPPPPPTHQNWPKLSNFGSNFSLNKSTITEKLEVNRQFISSKHTLWRCTCHQNANPVFVKRLFGFDRKSLEIVLLCMFLLQYSKQEASVKQMVSYKNAFNCTFF